MKTEYRDCSNCTIETDNVTEHALIGFVPQHMFDGTSSELWLKASVCLHCGSLHAQEISERDMDRAEQRYISTLVEAGIVSEEQAEEILG